MRVLAIRPKITAGSSAEPSTSSVPTRAAAASVDLPDRSSTPQIRRPLPAGTQTIDRRVREPVQRRIVGSIQRSNARSHAKYVPKRSAAVRVAIQAASACAPNISEYREAANSRWLTTIPAHHLSLTQGLLIAQRTWPVAY